MLLIFRLGIPSPLHNTITGT